MSNDWTFVDLLDKGGEYYQCARHMNPRGAADVLKECEPIVAKLKADHMDFSNLIEFMTKVGGRAPNIDADPFLSAVKLMWEKTR